jgi:hypothetical protein
MAFVATLAAFWVWERFHGKVSTSELRHAQFVKGAMKPLSIGMLYSAFGDG